MFLLAFIHIIKIGTIKKQTTLLRNDYFLYIILCTDDRDRSFGWNKTTVNPMSSRINSTNQKAKSA